MSNYNRKYYITNESHVRSSSAVKLSMAKHTLDAHRVLVVYLLIKTHERDYVHSTAT